MRRSRFIKSCLKAFGFSFLVPSILKGNSTAKKNAPASSPFKPEPSKWKDSEINIAWIGHSTVLINLFGTIILTDPVLFDRIGLYFFGTNWGPGRITKPALTFEEMPKPDIILLSHAHLDHMDYVTLQEFTTEYPDQIDCITAYNTMDVVADLKWKSIVEIDWNEEIENSGISFKGLEVKHFGWRFPWEWDRSKGYMTDGRSYNAVLIEKYGKTILFGGDTAFQELFKKINARVNVAIMPIGAYIPWRRNHCNPEEALIMAAEHLDADYFIPIHTKTFKQGTEPVEEPLEWLRNSALNYNIKLGLDDIGQTFTIKE